MRVLFFSYAYPNAAQPTLGTFNRSLLQALSKQHDVRVVSPVSFVEAWRSRLAGKSALDQNFAAIPNVTADYAPFYYPPKLFRERFDEFLWWSVGSKLTQTIRDFRPDVILSYWAHPDGAVAVRAGREHGIPAVAMVGGSDVLLLARTGRRRDAILQTLHQADAVVAVSRHIAETLEHDGLPAAKLHVVRRGIDRDLFQPGDRAEARRKLGLPADRFRLVTVGRLVSVKGQTHLIAACARLHREGQAFGCHILGNGPLRYPLQGEIQQLGLDGVVQLNGSQPQAELARWYRAADVTVLPSLSEGVPNVLLESISSGTPFIASDVGGIPEIADERFDELVPKEDPAALAEAIRRRITNPVQTPNGNLTRRFQPGSWDDSAKALCDVLAQVRGDHRSAWRPPAEIDREERQLVKADRS
jgi:glycosyltransferase involved in cell wall biosynthesis